jgi:hypothetical protein
MPWETTDLFTGWRDGVLETIPQGTKRNWALLLLSVLDPAAEKEPKDVIKAQFWNEALSALPQGEEREKQLAAFLIDLGCSSDGAPYVARGLIRNGLLLQSMGSQIAAVVDRFYKGKSNPTACLGVNGLTNEDWANLSKLNADSRPDRDENGEEKWR